MDLPYKTLTSKRLSSLVKIIRVSTIIGVVGIAISILSTLLHLFSIKFLNPGLFVPSFTLIFISGILAVLVSFEESYRVYAETRSSEDKLDK